MAAMLTAHFSVEELTRVGRHSCIDNTLPMDLLGNLLKVAEKLEQARAIWGVPVRVSYAYRGPELNAAVGGSPTSAHVLALAADAIPRGIEIEDAFKALVADRVFMVDVDQLIPERGCIHIGLPIPRYNYVPRHELRGDATVNGRRTYPPLGIWTPGGIR